MKLKSPMLEILLREIRQHPAFPEFMSFIDRPQLPVFKPRKNGQVEQAQANWIFQSGKVANHLAWLHFLSGTEIPSDDQADDHSSAEKE